MGLLLQCEGACVSSGIDVLGQISLGLLGVLGILLAFEGFLVVLLYSGTTWGPAGKNLLKVFIGAMAFAVVVAGYLCIDAASHSQFWKNLDAGGLFFVPVAVIMISAVAVGVYVISKA